MDLWAAIPYDRQAAGWSESERARYDRILSQADRVDYVRHDYAQGCLLERNRYMVDRATHLLAVYDGQPGGTAYTVGYARKRGLAVRIIVP